jgi:hypothetical protein
LIYKGSFEKKKKKRSTKDEKIPGIMGSSSGPDFGSGIGSGTGSGTGSSSTFLGRAISSSSIAALEVKNGRAKATIED